MIQLDIFSDPICPWCYIGKAYLDRALEANPDHPFQIRWLPFMLNPDMPAAGMDRRAYLEGKFGGQDGAVQAYLPVEDNAAKAGLTLPQGAGPGRKLAALYLAQLAPEPHERERSERSFAARIKALLRLKETSGG